MIPMSNTEQISIPSPPSKNIAKLQIRNGQHQGKAVLLLNFPERNSIQEELRKNLTLGWSPENQSWWVSFTKTNFELVLSVLRRYGYVDYQGLIRPKAEKEKSIPKTNTLSEINLQRIETFSRWMKSKRYSDSTIKTYTEAIKTFLHYFNGKRTEDIGNYDLIDFNNDYILKNKLSSSYQNQIVNGVKLFFSQIENRSLDIDLVHRPKRQKLLPNVLSKEEIKAILQAPANLKHKAMLSLIYSCGLRSGELIQLKPEHVDGKRNILIIKQAKGKKDRIAPLSNKTLQLLRAYYEAFRPQKFLFEGQKAGEAYDSRSLQMVLKQSLIKARISKPVTLHWLRHSYATHLLENGTDLRYIQEILGHSSSKTTEIYTHVSTKSIQNIVSPFDTL